MSEINSILEQIESSANWWLSRALLPAGLLADVHCLVEALREAVAALDRCPCDHAETLERVEAALRGDAE